MTALLEELKTTASSLPPSESAEPAHYLLRTLEPDEDGAATDWPALAQQRMADIHAGHVTGIPAGQVLESMRRPRT